MKICNIILDNWTVTTTGEPVRYSINYSQNVDACIVLWKQGHEDNEQECIWQPSFNHKFYFLNMIFQKSYGVYIKGTSDVAKEVTDVFLKKISSLIAFI